MRLVICPRRGPEWLAMLKVTVSTVEIIEATEVEVPA
jgi:hypothetical protein